MDVNEHGSDPNSETLAQLEQMHSGGAQEQTLPGGYQEPVAEPVPAETASEPEESTPDLETFEVEGHTFASEREAFDWLKNKYSQSETEKLILEARTEGMQAALGHMPANQTAAEPAPEEPIIDENAFYENPTKYMMEREAKIRESLKQEIMKESAQASAEEKAWGDFFKAHPDLEDFRTDCQMVLNDNLQVIQTLAAKDKKKAQDYLATKTREKFQNYIEKMKPTKVLSNVKGGPSAGNVTNNVTPQKPASNEVELDFASQLRNMKNKRR